MFGRERNAKSRVIGRRKAAGLKTYKIAGLPLGVNSSRVQHEASFLTISYNTKEKSMKKLAAVIATIGFIFVGSNGFAADCDCDTFLNWDQEP